MVIIEHPYIDAYESHISNYYCTNLKTTYIYRKFIIETNGPTIKYLTKEYDFLLRKVNDTEEDSYIFIFMGNKNKCVKAVILIDKITKKLKNVVDVQIFGHYEECNKIQDYEEGVLHCFIDFIKKKYKNIKKIYLTDNCIIKFCNNTGKTNKDFYTEFYKNRYNGLNIPYKISGQIIYKNQLSLLYFFKYRSFYYTDKYGFKMCKKYKKKYLENNQINKKFLDFFQKNVEEKSETNKLKKISTEIEKHSSIPNFLENYKFKNGFEYEVFFETVLLYYKIDFSEIFEENLCFFLL